MKINHEEHEENILEKTLWFLRSWLISFLILVCDLERKIAKGAK